MSLNLVREKAGPISYLIGGSGPPCLLLHGIPGSSYSWEAVGQRLAEHYRVLVPDLLGFGESDEPPGDFYMEAQAEAVRIFLSTLGVSQVVLAGHDFGGPVALTLLRLEPALRVQALVLSATNVFTDTHVPLPLRLASVPRLGRLFFKATTGTRVGLRMMYMAATQQKETATWEQYCRHLTPSGMSLTHQIFQRSLADLQGNYGPVEAMLAQIQVPTLVLWGEQDPFFSPAVARRTQRAIEGAWLRIYQQTGHFVPEERPDEVAQEIMEFLAQA